MQCQNRLKLLAISVHNHLDAHPAGMVGTVVTSAPEPEDRLSLHVSLLPYLEADHLYRQLDLKQPWHAFHHEEIVRQRLAQLFCGSDHRSGPEYINITHYVGITGVGEDSPDLHLKHSRAGYFSHGRPTKLADVVDGTSNTLLFLETQEDNGPWAAGGRPTLRCIDSSNPTPLGSRNGFGIVHSDTRMNWGNIKVSANLAMVDGSVRRISREISGQFLADLATLAGGEEIPASW